MLVSRFLFSLLYDFLVHFGYLFVYRSKNTFGGLKNIPPSQRNKIMIGDEEYVLRLQLLETIDTLFCYLFFLYLLAMLKD